MSNQHTMSTTKQHDNTDVPEEESLQDQLNAMDVDDEAAAFFNTLLSELDQAKADANDAYTMVRSTRKRIQELEAELERLETENNRLRERLDDVDGRTKLLQSVETSNRNVVEKRALKILQTLYNKALREKRKNSEAATPKHSMDYNRCDDVTGGRLHREQLYAAMERCEEIVETHGDSQNSPVEFVKETRSSSKNTRVRIDLTNTDRLEIESDGEKIAFTPEEGF